MTKRSFEADALRYVLEEMDARERTTFEAQLGRFPAARIALEECSDALWAVRRQPVDLPVFTGFVERELARLIGAPRRTMQQRLRQGVYQLREFIAQS